MFRMYKSVLLNYTVLSDDPTVVCGVLRRSAAGLSGVCHCWQCWNMSVEGFFLFTKSIRFFRGGSLYTLMPVYYVHIAKMNTVYYNSPEINPTFMKVLVFVF